MPRLEEEGAQHDGDVDAAGDVEEHGAVYEAGFAVVLQGGVENVYPPAPEELPALSDSHYTPTVAGKAEAKKPAAKKKRICKFPGCTKTVKAQGHCQRHGAVTKRCKVPDCTNQAQGSHDGYCKRHWREFAAPEDQRRKTKKKQEEESTTCEPVGSSVYDEILPASFAWKVEGGGGIRIPKKELKSEGGSDSGNGTGVKMKGADGEPTDLIPILQHFVDNQSLDPGWHRSAERLSRGIKPPKAVSTQLEPWEKALAITEFALIAGNTKHLSHNQVTKMMGTAWGRDAGFHKIMISKLCARRGELERKRRVDAGTPMTAEKKAALKEKQQEAKRRRIETMQQELFVPALPAPTGEDAAMGGGEQYAQQQEVTLPPLEEPVAEAMEEPSIEVEEMATSPKEEHSVEI